jgi:hypothetical protein
MRTAALVDEYLDLGWSLCAIRPGEKRPLGKEWQVNPTERALWEKYPDFGVGLIHAHSGTCALDLDDMKQAAALLRKEGVDVEALLREGVQIVSGKANRGKLLYRAPAGVELRRVAVRGGAGQVAYELRGGLCQDVLPPTIHPDTGKPYSWVGDFGDLPELPPALLALWQRAMTPAPDRNAAAAPVREYGKHGGVIERFNAHADIGHVLEMHGYLPSGARWCAPESTSGDAGVVLLPDSDPPRVYSHHASCPLADGHSHDAFSVWCTLAHGGDVKAAVREAGQGLDDDADPAARETKKRREAIEAKNAEREVALLEAAAELVERVKVRVPRAKALAVAADALEVDADNAVRWLLLAEGAGPVAARKMLGGGVRALEALPDAERAVEIRREREKADREWRAAQSRGVPQNRQRAALLTVTHPDAVSIADERGEQIPYLPGGLVGLVVAAGGTGKTTWLAELAMRVAWGDAAGATATADAPPYRVETDAHGPVLVLLAEEDADGVDSALSRGLRRVLGNAAGGLTDDQWRGRVFALGGADRSTALGALVSLEDPVRGTVTEVVPTVLHERLCDVAAELGPMLIVLDPINQLLPSGASENDAAAAAAMIALAGEIRRKAEEGVRKRWAEKAGRSAEEYNGPRPVVLLAHHESKAARADDGAGAGAARGSSAFTDNARWMLRMTVDLAVEGRSVFALAKTNYTRSVTHDAERVWDANGLAWRQPSAEKRHEWTMAKAPKGPAEKWDAETLVAMVRAEKGEGMRKSTAQESSDSGVLAAALESGALVEARKGRVFVPEHAPAEGETANKASEEDPMAGIPL